jgi:hypothetical protein
MHQFSLMRLVLPAIFLAGSSVALADTIGGANSACATCDGAAYTLTYSGSPISTTDTTQTFQITLDVNDSIYTGGGTFLNAVAIKIAAPADILSSSLVSAPATFSLMPGGLSATGCDGSSDGFLCAQSSGNGAAVTGGPYDFVYDITVDTGALLTGLNAAGVKGLYVDNTGAKVGDLLSEDITLQSTESAPEPTSALMLGSGLLALGLVFRGVRQQS